MAYKNLLTTYAKLVNVEQTYFAPAVVIPQLGTPLTSIYCLLAKVDPWADDLNPPDPKQDQKSIKSFFKNMFVAKLVTASNISPVIRRINWETDTKYDYYRDDIDLFQTDQNSYLIYNFYVINKCSFKSNNNRNAGRTG